MAIRSGPVPVQRQQVAAPPTMGVERIGLIWQVPCPWCRVVHDFRPFVGQEHGGTGEGSVGFEIGAVFVCSVQVKGQERGCLKKFQVADIRRETVVKVRPVSTRK